MNIMKRLIGIICLIFTLCACYKISAQPYLDGHKRYSFAQTVVGLDLQYIPLNGSSAFINTSNTSENYDFGNILLPRFTISGLHFWGHAEFYVNIPIGNIKLSETESVETTFSTSVETGFKYYPWRIEQNKLRPFIGSSLNGLFFTQKSDFNGSGTDLVQSRFPIHSGFTFNHKNSLLELGMSFYPRNRSNYYISRTELTQVEMPRLAFNLGYKLYFDTTIGASRGTENGYFDKKTKAMAAEGFLDGLSLGLGYSSIFFVKPSEYNDEVRPFLGNHKNGNTFFELGLGYYFFKNDFHINLAYRKMGAALDAYGVRQNLSRSALTLEAYKFVGDYHGFVPFIGPAISFEQLGAIEKDGDQTIFDIKKSKIAPGITFGWDIRPTRLQSLTLRTNLRYFPALHLKTESGKKLSFDNIEFNFIQLVYYPGVAKRVKNYKF